MKRDNDGDNEEDDKKASICYCDGKDKDRFQPRYTKYGDDSSKARLLGSNAVAKG